VPLGDLATAEVSEDPFVVALPKGHPLGRKTTLELSDLDGETVLLLDDGHCLRDQALPLCARAGAREAALRATSLATLVQMVSSGAGLTLLPSVAVDVENRRGQLEIRPFARPGPSRRIGFAWRSSSPSAEVFRVLARTASAALTSRG
jgi:LysR family transcriptional regulator, hydrogen peroxide-inducible genes activator